MKESHDNRFNALLTASLFSNVAKDAEAFLNADLSGIVDSPRIKRKILKQAKQKATPLWVGRLRIAAVACLVAAALAFTACMCIPEVRKAMWNAIITWNNGYIEINFKPSETSDDRTENATPNTQGVTEAPETQAFPSCIEVAVTPTYLPSGYSGTQTDYTLRILKNTYTDADGNFRFVLTQRVIDPEPGKTLTVDSDGAAVTTVSINNYAGVLIEYTYPFGLCLLTWQDSSYLYTLYGYFDSQEELIKIAKSVQITEHSAPPSPPTSIKNNATLTYLPSNFYNETIQRKKTQVILNFCHSQNKKRFRLTQSVIDPETQSEPIPEHATVTSVFVNGCEALLTEYSNAPNTYTLTWQDKFYCYSLHGYFDSTTELLKVAEGIKTES